jgi:hypothetical protein
MSPDVLSQSLTGRASTSLGPRCGSPAGGERGKGQTGENYGAHHAMQGRCAEPRRQKRFRLV